MKAQMFVFVHGWLMLLDGLVRVLSFGFLNSSFSSSYLNSVFAKVQNKPRKTRVLKADEINRQRWPKGAKKKNSSTIDIDL